MQRRGAVIGILRIGHTDTGNDERRTLRQMLQSPMEGRPVALGQAGVKVGWEVGTELLLTATATAGPRRRSSTRQTPATNPTGSTMRRRIGHVLGSGGTVTVTHVADGTDAARAVVDVELTGGLVALGTWFERWRTLGQLGISIELVVFLRCVAGSCPRSGLGRFCLL